VTGSPDIAEQRDIDSHAYDLPESEWLFTLRRQKLPCLPALDDELLTRR